MFRIKPEYQAAIVHLAAWSIYICAPFFIMPYTQLEMTDGDRWGMVIPSLFVMLVFYANYFVYVKRFLVYGQVWGFIICNILTVIAALFTLHYIMDMVHGPRMMMPPPPPDSMKMTPPPGPLPELPSGFHRRQFPIPHLRDAIIYVLAIGIGTAIRMTGKWYSAERVRKELEHERTVAELQNLKSQLNPHFLFNTLNNIYSFIGTDTVQAQKTMDELCQLLRHVLYECDKPTVRLSEELHFVSNYIELMRVRISEKVRLEVSLPEEVPDCSIAPCLYIMLIENAFKHGARNHPDSMISISIRIEEGKLISEIQNRCVSEYIESPETSGGVGLENLRRRLELLYPGHYSLECGRQGNLYRSFLCLDLQCQQQV